MLQIKCVQSSGQGPEKESFPVSPTYKLNMASRHPTYGETLESTQPYSLLLPYVLGKRRVSGGRFLAHVADLWLRVGMELLKLPAGRLATVFYKTKSQNLGFEKQSMSPDIEKGNSDETLPPITVERSRRSAKMSQDILDRRGHVFAWKNISLDLKVNGEQKRLLENIDGELPRLVALRRTRTNTWNRVGNRRSNDGSDGRVWSWKGSAISITRRSRCFANNR